MLEIEDAFTEQEQAIARRARNSNVNVPKSSSVQEYRSSTAFEAVLDFLYETRQDERLQDVMEASLFYNSTRYVVWIIIL